MNEIEKLEKEKELRLRLIGERQIEIYNLENNNKQDYEKVAEIEFKLRSYRGN